MNIVRKLFGPSPRQRVIVALVVSPVSLTAEQIGKKANVDNVLDVLAKLEAAGDVWSQPLLGVEPATLIYNLTPKCFAKNLPGHERERYWVNSGQGGLIIVNYRPPSGKFGPRSAAP